MRKGYYKAIFVPPPFGSGEWQLFNVAKDPGETEDLSEKNPKKMAELKADWELYANEVGVVEIKGAIGL